MATISNNTKGNKYHSEADGKFVSKDGGGGSNYSDEQNKEYVGGEDDWNLDDILNLNNDDDFDLDSLAAPDDAENKEEIDNPYGFKKIVGPHTTEEDLVKINKKNYDDSYKHFNPYSRRQPKAFKEYHYNCTHCAIAFAMRLKGYDVMATGLQPNDPFPSFMWKKVFKAPIDTVGGFDSGRAIIEHLDETLSQKPNGSHFLIVVRWKAMSSGHAFNAVVENHELVFYDPQSGERYGTIRDEKMARRASFISSYGFYFQ